MLGKQFDSTSTAGKPHFKSAAAPRIRVDICCHRRSESYTNAALHSASNWYPGTHKGKIQQVLRLLSPALLLYDLVGTF